MAQSSSILFVAFITAFLHFFLHIAITQGRADRMATAWRDGTSATHSRASSPTT
jgi:hypothetical protein